MKHGGEMTRLKLIGLIGLIVLAFGAGWQINGWRMQSAEQTRQIETVQAGADHLRNATEKVNEVAVEHVKNSYKLEEKIAELKRELSNEQSKNPLRFDCRPDPERLRIIKSAVSAANRAAARQ